MIYCCYRSDKGGGGASKESDSDDDDDDNDTKKLKGQLEGKLINN